MGIQMYSLMPQLQTIKKQYKHLHCKNMSVFSLNNMVEKYWYNIKAKKVH